MCRMDASAVWMRASAMPTARTRHANCPHPPFRRAHPLCRLPAPAMPVARIRRVGERIRRVGERIRRVGERFFLQINKKAVYNPFKFPWNLFENSKLLVLVIKDDEHYSLAKIARVLAINAFRR